MRSLPSRNPVQGNYEYVLFFPGIWLCCALSVGLRLIGPFFVVIPVGCCILFGLLRRVMPPRILGIYWIFCVLIAVLSSFRMLPQSWQIYFLPEAIIRQLMPVLGLFAVAWGSKAYFLRRISEGGVFHGAPFILVLSIPVAPLLTYAQGMGYEGDYSLYANLAEWGAFLNNMVIAFFFVSGALYYTPDWRRYLALGFMLMVCVMSHFTQFKILTAVTLTGLIRFPVARSAIGAVASFIVCYGVALNNVESMLHSHPNDGLRLVFIIDVFKSVADTLGLGIGYGKESVRWRYHFPGLPDFTFLPDPQSISHARMLEALSTGVHNSFAQALLRTGVLGCALLVIALFSAFPRSKVPSNVRNHAASLFVIIFIACFVNPALESPAQVVGIGFVYGYLLALNARARLGEVNIYWSPQLRPPRISPFPERMSDAPTAAAEHAEGLLSAKGAVRLADV